MKNINLLPWHAEDRKKQKNILRSRIAFIGIITIFLMILISIFYDMVTPNYDQQIKIITAEVKQLNQKMTALSKKQVDSKVIQGNVAALVEITENQQKFIKLIDTLIAVTPKKIRLIKLVRNDNTVYITGHSPDNSLITDFINGFNNGKNFTNAVLKESRVDETADGVTIIQFEIVTYFVTKKASSNQKRK